jgi:hypothetical protein
MSPKNPASTKLVSNVDPLLTVGALTRSLGIPRKRISAAIRSGALPAFQIGAWLRVRQQDAEAWLDRQRYRPPQPASTQSVELVGSA